MRFGDQLQNISTLTALFSANNKSKSMSCSQRTSNLNIRLRKLASTSITTMVRFLVLPHRFERNLTNSPESGRGDPKNGPFPGTSECDHTDKRKICQSSKSEFPKPDEPEPKRQHKPSVVRKIFGRSADLRPCKCSWVDQEKVCNPLGLKAFCLWRNSRRIHFDTSEFFAGNVKTELLRD